MYDGINDRNLSCPAVSQSCNRTPFESSKCTVFDKKSMPIVAWYVASNLSYMKREMTDVFPTDWSCCARIIYACACVRVDHNKNISKSALCLSLSLTIERERRGKEREKRFENRRAKKTYRKRNTQHHEVVKKRTPRKTSLYFGRGLC